MADFCKLKLAFTRVVMLALAQLRVPLVQVKSKVTVLLLKLPLTSCSAEVQQQAAETMHARTFRAASAAAASGARGGSLPRPILSPLPLQLPAASVQPQSMLLPSGRRSRFGPVPIQPCKALHSGSLVMKKACFYAAG